YPLRLAWAITIHKSQGLTFERAIIDANAAFSHGQVYVALSRCKTFEGMVLSTPISQSAVRTDNTIAQFVTHASQNQPTQEQLDNAKILYQQKLMLECFDYQYLHMNLTKLIRVLHDNSHLIQFSGMETVENMQRRAFEEIITVGEKFKRQMQSLFNAKMPEDDAHLQERVQKAANYFSGKLKPGLIEWASSFSFDTDNKQAGKQINKALEFLRHTLLIKAAGLESCREGFSNGAYLNALATVEIGFKSKTPAKKPAPGYIDSDVEHPELFNALREWRAEQAAEEEVEHYRVLHQKVLIRIATVLPDTVESLLQIKGIGKRIAEKHGARLTAMVAEYCREHQIKPQPSPTPTPKEVVEKREKPDTKRISYESYTQGKNIKEIAAERGLATNTIEGHL
ncbi:MAG: helicase, partial [Proteobacteria bacterium]|nr:helicase [Pseudomonadota bacterium]